MTASTNAVASGSLTNICSRKALGILLRCFYSSDHCKCLVDSATDDDNCDTGDDDHNDHWSNCLLITIQGQARAGNRGVNIWGRRWLEWQPSGITPHPPPSPSPPPHPSLSRLFVSSSNIRRPISPCRAGGGRARPEKKRIEVKQANKSAPHPRVENL